MAWINLSRWTWIGIAASVIWFVLFGGYLFVAWSLELQDSVQRDLDLCYRALNFELQSDELRGGQSGLKACIAQAGSGTLGAQDLLSVALMDIGTIILGWMAVVSTTLIIRIKEGSRS